jgi:hypothetical protein
MKQRLFVCLLIFLMCSIQLNAQTDDAGNASYEPQTSVRANEIKLNVLFFILGVGEFQYERLLNKDSGLGVYLSFPMFIDSDSEPISTELNYFLAPYYRIYFGKKYAAGFFVEGFAMLNSYERRLKEPVNFQVIEDVTDFALGIGLGGKWVLKDKLVFELSWGLGRNLFNTNDYDDSGLVGRGGFSLAYRF